ncbi:MAG: NFACT RNA binding domain-containing protein [Candidatus Cloacimonetes bacterium]|nr:NFACT RNA binding domain-containing protein [Candidatus Cloacimonadota bacterium]
MNIIYYKKWIEQSNLQGLNYNYLERFEETYLISFKEKNMSLAICLYNNDNILFTSHNKLNLPFQKTSELQNFNFTLNHSNISDIELINNDKIIRLEFTKWNIYNQKEIYNLFLEMIPRYQNIILCKYENNSNVIIECLKKISFAENNTRQILPGSEYLTPQTDFIQKEEDIFISDVNSYFSDFFEKQIVFSKMNFLKNTMLKTINKEYKKILNKEKKQITELNSALNIDIWKQYIELLKSSFNEIKQGMEEISLTNYYDMTSADKGIFPIISIPLKKEISPQKNIDYYAKKYRKALKGQKIIKDNLSKTKKELAHLEEITKELSQINDYIELKDFQEQTMSQNDFIGNSNNKNDKQLFRKIPINDDWEILIGRSNKENDLLTCKTAKGNDWWFHTRVFHGTHIVLRNFKKQTPPEQLIIICCQLAAWFSKAKHSSNVPVDYTQIRYVRKPRGSAPGYVIYTNQKTFYADPLDYKKAHLQINSMYQIKNGV